MSGLLTAANEEELSDLLEWLSDHPADLDCMMRWQAQTWLGDVMHDTKVYPASIVVPSDHCEAIDGVIEDWCEILTAHDEEFLTTLVLDDAG